MKVIGMVLFVASVTLVGLLALDYYASIPDKPPEVSNASASGNNWDYQHPEWQTKDSHITSIKTDCYVEITKEEFDEYLNRKGYR